MNSTQKFDFYIYIFGWQPSVINITKGSQLITSMKKYVWNKNNDIFGFAASISDSHMNVCNIGLLQLRLNRPIVVVVVVVALKNVVHHVQLPPICA